MHSRRSFLATLGAAVLGATIRPAGAAAGRVALDGPGVQLYTLRREMQRDVGATLARVAEIGYRSVEFAGYFERTPAQIAKLLKEHGLSAPSTHIGFDRMRDGWGAVLDEAAAIGHEYVTVPWIGPDDRRGIDGWKRVADLFNERAAAARDAGLRFAYHNHDFEFSRVGDAVPFDVLLAETDSDLVDFELDLYWVTRAGFDPLDYFARFPGRFAMTHLKDSAGAPGHEMMDVGSGTIDFPRLIAAARPAGVRHQFVEHDNPADPFASVRSSYGYLAGLS